MRTTIDKAGRLVIPRALRAQAGLVAGDVEVFADGVGVRVEPVSDDGLEERHGRLAIPESGAPVSDELVRALRDGDQR